jgi:hypothetical protein
MIENRRDDNRRDEKRREEKRSSIEAREVSIPSEVT